MVEEKTVTINYYSVGIETEQGIDFQKWYVVGKRGGVKKYFGRSEDSKRQAEFFAENLNKRSREYEEAKKLLQGANRG